MFNKPKGQNYVISSALPQIARPTALWHPAKTLDVRVSQAVQNQLAPLEFLALLLDDELETPQPTTPDRENGSIGLQYQPDFGPFRLLRSSRDQSNLDPGFGILRLYPAPRNILMCGPSGVGKSHLANALALEALKRDFRVLIKSTPSPVE